MQFPLHIHRSVLSAGKIANVNLCTPIICLAAILSPEALIVVTLPGKGFRIAWGQATDDITGIHNLKLVGVAFILTRDE